MEDELYVFADDALGARLFMNALATDLELFRWRDEGGELSIEPLQSVSVSDGEAEANKPGARVVFRYSRGTERTCWDNDKEVLRLEPSRGTGTRYAGSARYATSALNEFMCDALQRHLGLALTPDGARR
jgi:hypothetical protein